MSPSKTISPCVAITTATGTAVVMAMAMCGVPNVRLRARIGFGRNP